MQAHQLLVLLLGPNPCQKQHKEGRVYFSSCSRLSSWQKGSCNSRNVGESITLCPQPRSRERRTLSLLSFIQSRTPVRGVMLPTVCMVFPRHLTQYIHSSQASPEVTLHLIQLSVNISYYIEDTQLVPWVFSSFLHLIAIYFLLSTGQGMEDSEKKKLDKVGH